MLLEPFAESHEQLAFGGNYLRQTSFSSMAPPIDKRKDHIPSRSDQKKTLTAFVLLPNPETHLVAICSFGKIVLKLDIEFTDLLSESPQQLSENTRLITVTQYKLIKKALGWLMRITVAEPSSSKLFTLNYLKSQEYAA